MALKQEVNRVFKDIMSQPLRSFLKGVKEADIYDPFMEAIVQDLCLELAIIRVRNQENLESIHGAV